MTSLLLLGFLIGMRHAIEADHVAAVASLVTRHQSVKQAVKQGIVWGFGHTLTLFIVGAVVLTLETIITERLAQYLELVVGFMLVALGTDVLKRLFHKRIHFHMHEHGNGAKHFHAHTHGNETSHELSNHEHRHTQGFPYRALFIGLMHGMAGSAALILLTMGTVNSLTTGLVYIALFGLGSIVGMSVLSIVIAIPLRYSANGMTRIHYGLHAITGLATLVLGMLLIYEIGISEQIFISLVG